METSMLRFGAVFVNFMAFVNRLMSWEEERGQYNNNQKCRSSRNALKMKSALSRYLPLEEACLSQASQYQHLSFGMIP
jgi:hypothetical protein